jgi:hypothetical protein
VTASFGNLVIAGGHLTVTATASTSGAIGGSLNQVTFEGRPVVFCRAASGVAALSPTAILFSNASAVLATDGVKVFGVSPSSAGSLNLTLLYAKTTTAGTEALSGLGLRYLHFPSLSLPASRPWFFCLSGESEERCFGVESADVASAIVSVPSLGSYSVKAWRDGAPGFLQVQGGSSVFQVTADSTVVTGAVFVPAATPLAPSATEVFTLSFQAVFRPGRTRIFDVGLFLFWIDAFF